MKPLRAVALRACILALVLLSMGANIARADDELPSGAGGSTLSLPEDPGF